MKLLLILCVGLAALGAANTTSGMSGADVVVVKLKPFDRSGVSGTATLTRLAGDRTRVVIVLDKREPGKLPAHLHAGPCKVN